jgi:hypothetical protein
MFFFARLRYRNYNVLRCFSDSGTESIVHVVGRPKKAAKIKGIMSSPNTRSTETSPGCVCICMYVCMHVYMHVCIMYVCMYICMYVYMYVCMCNVCMNA